MGKAESSVMKYRFLASLLLVAGMIPALSVARISAMPMVGLSAGGTALTAFYVLGFELGPWQDYLAYELTPDFMLDPQAELQPVSWMTQHSVVVLPFFAKQLLGEPETFLKLEVDWQYSNELAMNSFDPVMSSHARGMERRLISPGLMHRLNDNQLIGISAVFATQSFGVSRLGLQTYDQSLPVNLRSSAYDPYHETGYGAGVSLAMRSEITEGITLDAGFRSRIDMNEFANHRGVYSQPADLDIPARAKLGLAFQASGNSWLNVSVERVLYSEIGAFASGNLPGRFLSLLGD
jgi:hypothetical protein